MFCFSEKSDEPVKTKSPDLLFQTVILKPEFGPIKVVPVEGLEPTLS